MNLIKSANAPVQGKKLSLDRFKDKMVEEVHQEKGGDDGSIFYEVGKWLGETVRDILDSCHD